MTISVALLLVGFLACLVVGLVAGYALGLLGARAHAASTVGADAAVVAAREQAGEAAVLRESLERLHDHLRDLEHSRVDWQGRLHQQVDDVRRTTDDLRRETSSLATSLRRPQVRGRWGEMHLRRTVELAGLVDRCDFEEQVRLSSPTDPEGADPGARRPDLVVRLAGGRSIVVDAKVPLDAFLDATEVDPAGPSGPSEREGGSGVRDQEQDERRHHLRRHARQVRQHVDTLAAKAYWRSLPGSPDFVVLFVPAETFLTAALEADPSLLEHASARHVVLASPTTLIALLRTVALGWSQAALSDQARDVHRLGRELHQRLATWSAHLDAVGRSLNAAVTHYNSAVGSLETRVLVSARRFDELGVSDDELPGPRAVGLRAVDRRGVAEEGPSDRTVAL